MEDENERIAVLAAEAAKGKTTRELSELLDALRSGDPFGEASDVVRGIVQATLTIRQMEEEARILEEAEAFRATGRLAHFLTAAALYANTTPLVRHRLAELEALVTHVTAPANTAHVN